MTIIFEINSIKKNSSWIFDLVILPSDVFCSGEFWDRHVFKLEWRWSYEIEVIQAGDNGHENADGNIDQWAQSHRPLWHFTRLHCWHFSSKSLWSFIEMRKSNHGGINRDNWRLFWKSDLARSAQTNNVILTSHKSRRRDRISVCFRCWCCCCP